MVNKIKLFLITAGLCISAGLMTHSASAAGLDGASNLVCANVDVMACTGKPDCKQGHARTFDLPEFMFIDFKKKVVRSTRESAHKAESPIKNLQKDGTQLILQGVENGHGWSISIDQKNGRMTAVASGEDLGFIIFGACTAL